MWLKRFAILGGVVLAALVAAEIVSTLVLLWQGRKGVGPLRHYMGPR